MTPGSNTPKPDKTPRPLRKANTQYFTLVGPPQTPSSPGYHDEQDVSGVENEDEKKSFLNPKVTPKGSSKKKRTSSFSYSQEDLQEEKYDEAKETKFVPPKTEGGWQRRILDWTAEIEKIHESKRPELKSSTTLESKLQTDASFETKSQESDDPWEIFLGIMAGDYSSKLSLGQVIPKLVAKIISDPGSTYSEGMKSRFLAFIGQIPQKQEIEKRQCYLSGWQHLVEQHELRSLIDDECLQKVIELDDWGFLAPISGRLTDARKNWCFIYAAKTAKRHVLENLVVNDEWIIEQALEVAFHHLDVETARTVIRGIDKHKHGRVIKKQILQLDMQATSADQRVPTSLNCIGAAQRILKRISKDLLALDRQQGDEKVKSSGSEKWYSTVKVQLLSQKSDVESRLAPLIKKKNQLTLLILEKLIDVEGDTTGMEDPLQLVLHINFSRLSQGEFSHWQDIIYDLSHSLVEKVSGPERDEEYHRCAMQLNRMLCLMANVPSTGTFDPFVGVVNKAFLNTQNQPDLELVTSIILHELDRHIGQFNRLPAPNLGKARLCMFMRNSLEIKLRACWADKSQVKVLCAVVGDITKMLDAATAKDMQTKTAKDQCTLYYRMAVDKQANFGTNKKDAELWKAIFKFCTRLLLIVLLSLPYIPQIESFLLHKYDPMDLLLHYYAPAAAFIFTVMAGIGYWAEYLHRENQYFTDSVSKNIYSFYNHHMSEVTTTKEKIEDYFSYTFWW